MEWNPQATAAHRWGVILAGGGGSSLRAAGDFPGPGASRRTLVEQARARVGAMIAVDHTLIIMRKAEEGGEAGEAEAAGIPVLWGQPRGGSAPAILGSLRRVREHDPQAVVGFFPSDRRFADGDALTAQVRAAFEIAECPPWPVILLSLSAEDPPVAERWIEPGAAIAGASGADLRVTRFWERPSLTLAAILTDRSLWDRFVMVGRVDSFLRLISRTLPGLVPEPEAPSGSDSIPVSGKPGIA